jgi:hypothetical protein
MQTQLKTLDECDVRIILDYLNRGIENLGWLGAIKRFDLGLIETYHELIFVRDKLLQVSMHSVQVQSARTVSPSGAVTYSGDWRT